MSDTVIEEHARHRQSVVRRALFFTPIGALITLALLYSMTALPASIFPVIFLALGAIGVDIQAIDALRDLRATPITTTGRVSRLMHKGRFLFLGRVHYLWVGRSVFEIRPDSALVLQEGDPVEVVHWPHSHVVVRLTRGTSPAAASEAR